MKFRYVLVGSMFLAGCQLTGQNDVATTTNTPEQQEKTQTPAESTQIVKESVEVEVVEPVVTPQSQEDVWKRISMQLEMPVPDSKRVNYYRNWYLKHPQHLETVAKRAEPFLYLITEKVEERGIPLEIALLPIVESSFRSVCILSWPCGRLVAVCTGYRPPIWPGAKLVVRRSP